MQNFIFVQCADYSDIATGSIDRFSVTVAHKCTETESECYPMVDSLLKTIDFLKVKLNNKQRTIGNLLNIIKNFIVNKNKKERSREQQAIKVRTQQG